MVGRKKALMRLWKDTFCVTEYREITDASGATGFEEVRVLEDLPCKLSFSSLGAVNQADDAAMIVQSVKLFCDDELTVKPGSKIAVTRGGIVTEYSQSGEPALYPGSHLEIMLVPFEGYA
jgi:hypothetical protein